MKKFLAFVSATAIVLCAAVLPAKAMEPYMIFQGGAYIPYTDDMDDVDAAAGFAGNVAFGLRFIPYLSAQIESGYMQSDGDFNFTLSAIPLVAAVRGGFPIGIVEPYAIAGGGAYFMSAKAETDDGDTLYDTSSTEFGLFAGGGVNFNIEKFIVGAEMRYLVLGNEDVNVDGLMAFVNLGFKF